MPHDKKITAVDRHSTYWGLIEVHGPFFNTIVEKEYPSYKDGVECILVRSDTTGWVGHLEISEIHIVEHHKTPCTSAVLKFLGVKEWEKSQYREDCTEALEEAGWIVEAMSFTYSETIDLLRKQIQGMKTTSTAEYYMVFVSGHVLVLNNRGVTACDTDPRKRDSRRVYGVYSVTPKERLRHTSALAYKVSQLNEI